MSIASLATKPWANISSVATKLIANIYGIGTVLKAAAGKVWSTSAISTSGFYPIQLYYVNGGTQIAGLFMNSANTASFIKKFNVSNLTTEVASYQLPYVEQEILSMDGNDFYCGSYSGYAMRFNWSTMTLTASVYGQSHVQRVNNLSGYGYLPWGGSDGNGYGYYTKSNNTFTYQISGTSGAVCQPVFGPSNIWGAQYYYGSGYLYKFSQGSPPALLSTTALPWGNGVYLCMAYDTVHNYLWVMSTQNATYKTMYKVDPSTNAVLNTYTLPVMGGYYMFFRSDTQTLEFIIASSATPATTPPHMWSFDTNTYTTTDLGAITTDLSSPWQPWNQGQEGTYPRIYGSASYGTPNATINNMYKYS